MTMGRHGGVQRQAQGHTAAHRPLPPKPSGCPPSSTPFAHFSCLPSLPTHPNRPKVLSLAAHCQRAMRSGRAHKLNRAVRPRPGMPPRHQAMRHTQVSLPHRTGCGWFDRGTIMVRWV